MASTAGAISVNHGMVYRYDRPVALGPHVIRVRPVPSSGDRVLDYSLDVSPQPLSLRWQLDPDGNWIARALFDGTTEELRIEVRLRVSSAPVNAFDFLVDPSVERWPLVYDNDTWRELGSSLVIDAGGSRLADLVDHVRETAAGGATIDAILGLNRLIHERVGYAVRPLGEVQTPESTLAFATGSCRDSAWLLVQALRRLGFAARFVSGYLLPAEGIPLVVGPDPEGLEGGLHAWASVYLPGAGWLGLDPTSGTLAAETHLALASTCWYANAAPITGTSAFANVETSFSFAATPD